MKRNRVAVTGLGAVTPLARTMKETWDRLLLGQSGIRTIRSFDPKAFDLDVTIAGEISDFDPTRHMDKKQARRLDRSTQLGIAAAQEAIHAAALNTSFGTVGVVFGTGIGGFMTTLKEYEVFRNKGARRVSPFTIPMLMPNAVAGNISAMLQCLGPCLTPTSACSSGSDAIGIGLDLIRNGRIDACIVGATEAVVTPFCMAGFANMGALTAAWNDDPTRASRPFDADRSGFVLSEGSAALVLENMEYAQARGATIFAEVAGYGSAADGHHITAPHPKGEGAIRATCAALLDARLSPWAISYINAHGSSTPLNDAIEARVIRDVYGEYADEILVSSTKSMTGHLLGASGALEAAICVRSVHTGYVPPTINLDKVDPACELHHVHEIQVMKKRYAVVSNSFGFGGHNSVLIFKPYAR